MDRKSWKCISTIQLFEANNNDESIIKYNKIFYLTDESKQSIVCNWEVKWCECVLRGATNYKSLNNVIESNLKSDVKFL